MRVFVTGASGFVGSAVVRHLRATGHHVAGLARSETSAAALDAAGVEVVRGDLAEIDILAKAAHAADGVMHLGFIHDFANFAASAETDRRAIEALGGALAGTGKPLLVTSGIGLLAPGRLLTEADAPVAGQAGHRVSEVAAMAFVEQNVRVMAMRLPPSVHGDGDHGFVPTLIDVAHKAGVSAYVEDGGNRWPAVHVEDAAAGYVLALEKGAVGSRYHLVGDEGIAFKDIAETIGHGLGVPTRSIAADEAMARLGWIGRFAQLDVPAASQVTRDGLGWMPKGKGLLADLAEGTYFSA